MRQRLSRPIRLCGASALVATICFGPSGCHTAPDNTEQPRTARSARVPSQDPDDDASGWWKDPSITDKLALTEEQTEAIDALYADLLDATHQHRRIERRYAMALLRELRQEDVDHDLVAEYQQRLERMAVTKQKRKLRRVLELHQILSREQWILAERHVRHALAVGAFVPVTSASSSPVLIRQTDGPNPGADGETP